MQIGEALKDKHQALAVHFTHLAGTRGQLPVFAIEHNLNDTALSGLKAAIAMQLELDPQLQGAMWNWSYLPLLVVATEVGYRYRGTGTNFWPVLSQELGVEAGFGFRLGVSRLFELGHQSFRLSRPGESAWERHFPHIAWPIGNAVAPVEIHPPLTEALRRAIRAGISVENTDALYEHLKTLAAGHTSRRFENWLRQSEVATEVMRRLLVPDAEGWLSQGTLHRIDADIRGDLEAFRAITEARRVSARRSVRLTDLPQSRFVLSLVDGAVKQLLVRGPVLPSHLRGEVIATLRIQGDRLRAVGSDQSILLRSFLAGGEIELGSINVLSKSPLRRGDASQAGPAFAETVMENLQPRDADFFLVEPSQYTAQAIFPNEALSPNATVLQRLPIINNELPEFRQLATSSTSDASLLRKLGFIVLEQKPALSIIGMPMPGPQAQYASGFPILASPRHTGLVTLLDGDELATDSIQLRGTPWDVFQPSVGEHWLAPADAAVPERAVFQVIEPPDIGPAVVSILPSGATMADLMNGTLEIKITAPLALEGVSYRLLVSVAGHTDINVEGTIDRLPARISGRTTVMQTLRFKILEQNAENVGARLAVVVSGLLPVTIALPPVHRELHYHPVSDRWVDENELDQRMLTLVATPQDPLFHLANGSQSDFRLVLPDASDHAALPAGVLISDGTKLHLGQKPDAIVLPPLAREAHSHDGRVGLVDIARASIGWRLAEAKDPVTDWRRRTVVSHLEGSAIELLCGPAWLTMESGVDLSTLSPHSALHQCAEWLGLVSGEDLPRIESTTDRTFLRDRIIARLQEKIPYINEALEGLDDELASDLDIAVIDAYEDLRQNFLDAGRNAFEEVDMVRPASHWRKALQSALKMPLLPMFHGLILPEVRRAALINSFYDDLSEDDLIDLLDSCHVDAFRRPGVRWLDRPELRTMLQFWLSPQTLIDTEGWSQLLAKGLSDTQTARAVRYVALRYKLARLELPDGGPI